ncbi:MAG: hypothetical protein CMP65_05755 [Flavobacteriales bacterium]|nr:hypothetical protein [Flavobacteriales bacterium]|tara:strand:+ start:13423 stop:14655 length:1233 start_codon:yes stop_codon:yes gene_type:complete
MQNFILQKTSDFIETPKFHISGSKSISQRALIINQLMNNQTEIVNISDSTDTFYLNKCLCSNDSILNVSNSGTALRFLISFFALKNQKVIICGDSYLFNRPLMPLIKSLNYLGANIIKNKNKIYINEGDLKGGDVLICTNKTSQFVSSLLLIAPYLKGGLKLKFSQNIMSYSYILMTLKMMEYCGVESDLNNSSIIVPEQNYSQAFAKIESDWSSVSYLYLCFLFSDLKSIHITSFLNNSFQPDFHLISFFTICGIDTYHSKNSLLLKKNKSVIIPNQIDWDFSNNPDLSLSIFVACFGLNIYLRAKGIDTLFYKESNRIESVRKEFDKFNCDFCLKNNVVHLNSSNKNTNIKLINIDTHNDHRIALAFAPLVLLGYDLNIMQPNVVLKSYPNFFNDLIKFGVKIKKIYT